jgi:polyisoprenoid-binding protein YceI
MSRARRALLFLLVALAPMAAQAKPPTPAVALAIDGRHSNASFVVHLRMRKPAEGQLTGVSGQLAGTPAAGWRVKVRVDGRSLRLPGPRWMERVTRSDSFLAVNRYPSIRFESAVFSDQALRGGGPIDGELSLRGLTQPVSFLLLPSQCDRPGRDCDIHVQGSISRKAFGMTAYRAMVSDEVEFRFRVRLRQEKPTP